MSNSIDAIREAVQKMRHDHGLRPTIIALHFEDVELLKREANVAGEIIFRLRPGGREMTLLGMRLEIDNDLERGSVRLERER